MTTEASTDQFTSDLLVENAQRLFTELCTKETVNAAEAGHWPEALWNNLEELGFPLVAVPEAQGGVGMNLADAMTLVQLAGRHAAPVPLGETIVAAWLLSQAGLAVPAGPLAFAPADRRSKPVLRREKQHWSLHGTLRHIPWGNRVTTIALVVETTDGVRLACVDPTQATATSGTNLAGEPRVHLEFDAVRVERVAPVPAAIQSNTPYLLGALLRCLQMAGALSMARDLAVRYTSERIAFGKPLNRLQAVQQNLAVLAGQTAAAEVAASMASDALRKLDTSVDCGAHKDLVASVALAKIRINEAAEIGARLAHQAHGAIGFTYEHQLHLATRRLWSWRDEFGNNAYWSDLIGQRIVSNGHEGFWNFITQAAQL